MVIFFSLLTLLALLEFDTTRLTGRVALHAVVIILLAAGSLLARLIQNGRL